MALAWFNQEVWMMLRGIFAIVATTFCFGAVLHPAPAIAQCAITADGSSVGTVGDLLGAALGANLGVLCDGAIDGDSVIDGSLTGDDVADGSLTGDDVADGSLTGDDVADGSLTGDDIQDGSVGADDLASDSVGSDEIQAGAVGASELADGAVSGAAIQAGAIDTEHIADGAVTFDKLAPEVRDRINANTAGVAIALALENPDLTGNERFGLAMNWGMFNGAHALGLSATGVLGHNILGEGDRLAVSGGFGISTSNVMGGRVGAQLSW
jgi:hypothetical protein